MHDYVCFIALIDSSETEPRVFSSKISDGGGGPQNFSSPSVKSDGEDLQKKSN